MSQDLFQQAMDCILEECEGVIGKADDLTVFGKSREHDRNLHELLKTAQKYIQQRQMQDCSSES